MAPLLVVPEPLARPTVRTQNQRVGRWGQNSPELNTLLRRTAEATCPVSADMVPSPDTSPVAILLRQMRHWVPVVLEGHRVDHLTMVPPAACPNTPTDCSTATPPTTASTPGHPPSLAPTAVKDGDRNRPLLFPPGTDHHYSNTDYIVLGMITEEVTGRSYRTEIDQRIIRPLGLRDTRLPQTLPPPTRPHSHGYEPVEESGGTLVPSTTPPSTCPSPGAAGEIVSTTADLDHFFRHPAQRRPPAPGRAARDDRRHQRRRLGPRPGDGHASLRHHRGPRRRHSPATAPSPSTHATAPAKSRWTGPTGAPTPTPARGPRPDDRRPLPLRLGASVLSFG